jgi:hypothetical protein
MRHLRLRALQTSSGQTDDGTRRSMQNGGWEGPAGVGSPPGGLAKNSRKKIRHLAAGLGSPTGFSPGAWVPGARGYALPLPWGLRRPHPPYPRVHTHPTLSYPKSLKTQSGHTVTTPSYLEPPHPGPHCTYPLIPGWVTLSLLPIVLI